MKRLIALVLILALPTLALGATDFSVLVGGVPSLTVGPGTTPSLAMSVVLTLGPAEAGTFGFGGALQGPQGTIAGRVYGAPASAAVWLPNNADAAYFPQPIGAGLDFGSVETAAGSDVQAGSTTVVTLAVNNLPLVPGTYVYRVGDSIDYPPSGGGGVDMNTGWWSNTGAAVAVDTSTPFTLIVTPEPATMLLLALALPFLRRRSA